jgi:hypothetical protein
LGEYTLFNNKVIIIVASLIIAAGLIILGLSNRFYIDTSTQLKVDRLTGKTYRLADNAWLEIVVKYDVTLPEENDRFARMLGRQGKVSVKNVSNEFLIKYIEFELNLYKDEVLFYKESIRQESLNINPLSSFEVDYIMDGKVQYPDRPWKYSISTKEVKGLSMK